MDKIKEELIQLFDGMMPQIKSFKRKQYAGVFEEGFAEHKGVLAGITELCAEKTEEECEPIIEELASVIPDYAYDKFHKEPKMVRNRLEVDYNMNMAVYVIPILTYTHEAGCEKVAKRTVELWNEKPVTSLTLGQASYEEIAGGFRKGFCFITTAVCDSMDKPDDCYELTALRSYRDHYLRRTEEGNALVEEYYDIAPYLVQVINMQKDAAEIYRNIYDDYLVPCIHCIEENKNEECRHIYMDMVRGLQNKYLHVQEVRS